MSLSALVSLRWSPALNCQSSFPPAGLSAPAPLRFSLPSTKSPGVGSLASSVLWSAPTSLRPRQPQLPLTTGSLVVGFRSLRPGAPTVSWPPGRPGPDLRCATRGGIRGRRRDLPGSWTAPYVRAPLYDPGGSSLAMTFGSAGDAFRLSETSAPRRVCRGSITRPTRSLCTLQPPVTRRTATLGSGWWSAIPCGSCTR